MKLSNLFKSIFTIILIIGFYSCDSDSPDDNGNQEDYFIKAKINGQAISQSFRAQALRQGDQDNYLLSLYAGNSLSNVYPFFSCDIDNLTQIATGTYSRATHTMLFQFYNSNQTGYGNYDVNETNDFLLQITEVTNTYIKGVFQGVLWEETGLTETIPVTEGSFYLPRYYGEYGNTNPN